MSTLAERQRTFDANQMAVASFILALPGLIVFNLVLGPCAIALAVVALVRRTRRPVRAWLGLVLGLADLAVLAVSVAATHGTIWAS